MRHHLLAQQLFDEYGYSRGVKFPDSLGWSDEKEHHFFELDSRFKKGLDYYATAFPPCGEHVMTIDATPNALLREWPAAARIKELYGPDRCGATFAAICAIRWRALTATTTTSRSTRRCKDGAMERMAHGAADKINKGEKVGGIWSIGRLRARH